MTVLLSCSINLSSNGQVANSSTGVLGDSVKVSINDLRKANIKLIQLDYEKAINNNLRQIIVNDSVLAEQARQRYILLDRTCKKIKKQRNIGVGAAIGSILLFIISIIK
nr:MAG TPA: hemolysin [Crassvirales sp.]